MVLPAGLARFRNGTVGDDQAVISVKPLDCNITHCLCVFETGRTAILVTRVRHLWDQTGLHPKTSCPVLKLVQLLAILSGFFRLGFLRPAREPTPCSANAKL